MAQPDVRVTDSEWEVMRAVWAQDKVTSREIAEVLQKKKQWGTATIKTFLGRLVKKGMLKTEKDGKQFLYSASIEEADFIRTTLDETFENICNKDTGNTIVGLIEKSMLSFDDIERLQETLEMKKKDAVDDVPCNCAPGQCRCHMNSHGNSNCK